MWYNPIMTWLIRSPLHFFVSKNMMLMTYQGRKSGKIYTTPMNYSRIYNGDGEYLLAISSRERVWWRNLRGGAPVTLRLQGKDVQANAECFEDVEEIAADLTMLLKTNPAYARYLDIRVDADGVPQTEDIRRTAQERVTVRVKLS
jgi:deazaflavin-dependent oxidoreductase (nitroreductase family)